MKPIIRWVGGKKRLCKEILSRFPQDIDTYYEPFAGGAAVLLELIEQIPSTKAIASDNNPELINFYQLVQKMPADVCELANAFLSEPEQEKTFYAVRALDVDSEILRAARFAYLQKTSFNGLWRVNHSTGKYNTPWGHNKKPKQIDVITYFEFAKLTRSVEFRCQDFESALNAAKVDDFVYALPSLSLSFNIFCRMKFF